MIAFVTGGASCGKSAYAEQLCVELGGRLVYLAAMKPFGEEGARRVRKHRAQRAGKGFETVECYEDFSRMAHDERLDGATVLLECLGNVAANELFADDGFSETGDVRASCEGIMDVIDAIAERCAHLVIVGNEVGSDGVAYPGETRAYQDLVGSLACALAERSSRVVECVAGVPIVMKG
jgi:adenosylcobinamide kinase/adenosylcobinamide-phosphate guanylyltransferase